MKMMKKKEKKNDKFYSPNTLIPIDTEADHFAIK
jgi:hypothetical protein